jgi:hypothetical protein
MMPKVSSPPLFQLEANNNFSSKPTTIITIATPTMWSSFTKAQINTVWLEQTAPLSPTTPPQHIPTKLEMAISSTTPMNTTKAKTTTTSIITRITAKI